MEIVEKGPLSKMKQGPGTNGEDAVYVGAAVLIHKDLPSEMGATALYSKPASNSKSTRSRQNATIPTSGLAALGVRLDTHLFQAEVLELRGNGKRTNVDCFASGRLIFPPT